MQPKSVVLRRRKPFIFYGISDCASCWGNCLFLQIFRTSGAMLLKIQLDTKTGRKMRIQLIIHIEERIEIKILYNSRIHYFSPLRSSFTVIQVPKIQFGIGGVRGRKPFTI